MKIFLGFYSDGGRASDFVYLWLSENPINLYMFEIVHLSALHI